MSKKIKKLKPKLKSSKSRSGMPGINLLTNYLAQNKKTLQIVALIILIVGGIITLDQVHQSQDNRSRAAGDCTVTATELQITANEQKMFDDINAYRAQNKLAPLTWNTPLNQAASWMSHDMFTTKNVSPNDSLGRSPDTRFSDCGVAKTNQIGESVISGENDANTVFAGLKIDPQDSGVILNPHLTLGAVDEEVDTAANVGYWTFTAAGPDIPVNSGPSVAPSVIVPSAACLGTTCISTAPSVQPSTAIAPSNTVTPSTAVAPSGTLPGTSVAPIVSGSQLPSLVPSASPSGPASGGGNGSGQSGGFLGLFLAFLLLILKFFLSLFGK